MELGNPRAQYYKISDGGYSMVDYTMVDYPMADYPMANNPMADNPTFYLEHFAATKKQQTIFCGLSAKFGG